MGNYGWYENEKNLKKKWGHEVGGCTKGWGIIEEKRNPGDRESGSGVAG